MGKDRLVVPSSDVMPDGAPGTGSTSGRDSYGSTIRDHAQALLRDGVVVLPDVIDPALLDRCVEAVPLDPASNGFQHTIHWTDEGRFYAPLALGGAFADPQVFANPVLVDVARAVLDNDCVLDSFGVIVSLPGAAAQRVHEDGYLYPGTPCDRLIPPFALTFAIPLVDLNPRTGSTAFFRKSHRTAKAEGQPDFIPEVPRGSAMLWDYRVLHRGEPNRSKRPRPVLFGVYCRAWWNDTRNYADGERRLPAEEGVRDNLDQAGQRLLRRATIMETAR